MLDKVIVIVGATATKKTTLAKQLANYFDIVIINADVFQMYQELNIGINKSSKEEIKKYDIKLIDCLEINESMDIAIYQQACNKLIKEIIAQNKIPVICGGSNLYIDAVIKGYNLNKVKARNEINYFDNWSYDDIYEYVFANDPLTALKINKNNKKRIIRAAQIIYSLKQPKDKVENEKNQYVYDCLIIETTLDRNQLYEQINKRVDEMIKNNWSDEVKNILLKHNNFLTYQSSHALGYSDIAQAIINNQPINDALIKQKTRNYAKKQLTWNRNKYDNKISFNLQQDDLNRLIKDIKNFLNK